MNSGAVKGRRRWDTWKLNLKIIHSHKCGEPACFMAEPGCPFIRKGNNSPLLLRTVVWESPCDKTVSWDLPETRSPAAQYQHPLAAFIIFLGILIHPVTLVTVQLMSPFVWYRPTINPVSRAECRWQSLWYRADSLFPEHNLARHQASPEMPIALFALFLNGNQQTTAKSISSLALTFIHAKGLKVLNFLSQWWPDKFSAASPVAPSWAVRDLEEDPAVPALFIQLITEVLVLLWQLWLLCAVSLTLLCFTPKEENLITLVLSLNQPMVPMLGTSLAQ